MSTIEGDEVVAGWKMISRNAAIRKLYDQIAKTHFHPLSDMPNTSDFSCARENEDQMLGASFRPCKCEIALRLFPSLLGGDQSGTCISRLQISQSNLSLSAPTTERSISRWPAKHV